MTMQGIVATCLLLFVTCAACAQEQTVAPKNEGLALYSFDPGKKKYRNWFFSSAFLGYASQGSWNEAKQTFSLTASRDDGKTTKTSLRFDGPDREVWHTLITDAAGKIYVDMDSTLTQKK